MRILFVTLLLAACSATPADSTPDSGANQQQDSTKIVKTESEWKAELTTQEYYVLRQKGTERAFSGKYWDHKGKGTYVCAGCALPLFSSDTKFKSGTGWPSYWEPVNETNVAEESDRTYGMARTEVLCSRCGGHLGHVFNDGPRPTGMRYCINSVSLDFVPSEDE